jgi:predicted nucleotidyltransferase
VSKLELPEGHRTFVDRLIAACEADDRIVAAFLGGSCAEGRADAWSDLDLTLVTKEEAFEPFVARREEFFVDLENRCSLKTSTFRT